MCLDWLDQVDQRAVVDIEVDTVDDVVDLLGFVVEPATRRGIELVIVADREIEDLDEEGFAEAEFRYPYSLERLRWRLRGIRLPRDAPAALPQTDFAPDPTQMAAVGAGDGVVQIIAPAGSGKTTVLAERVRELRRRGVPAKAIACVTLQSCRQRRDGGAAGGGRCRERRGHTFHGLGRRILVDAGCCSRTPRSPIRPCRNGGGWPRPPAGPRTASGSSPPRPPKS